MFAYTISEQRNSKMAENTEQLKQAVQVVAQVADRALVDGPVGRQRDQAVQILAQHVGLTTEPQNNPPIEMPNVEASTPEVESN